MTDPIALLSSDLYFALVDLMGEANVPIWLATPMPWLGGDTPHAYVQRYGDRKIWDMIGEFRGGGAS